VAGGQVEVLAQAQPATYVDHERLSGVFGYGNLPDAHESPFGWLLLARAGIARGAYGSATTPFAVQGGLTLDVPIRPTAKDPPWNADQTFDANILIIPSLNATALYAFEVPKPFQLEISASLSLGVRLWTSLVP
jgi:hypothetical protein